MCRVPLRERTRSPEGADDTDNNEQTGLLEAGQFSRREEPEPVKHAVGSSRRVFSFAAFGMKVKTTQLPSLSIQQVQSPTDLVYSVTPGTRM